MNSPTDVRLSENPAPLNWLRRFFSCNPLYLASAGLLLYGINRLSSEPRLTGAEPAQIAFNFAALFLYEVLLVVTAIALARRKIWYDALLLVALENLFVLVPFSLVSRAVQLDESFGRKLCLAAVLLALLRFWALRRYIPHLNLPPRLLAFGGLIMAANVALALGLRRIFDDPHAVNSWLNFGWLIGLPALIALANLLPKPALTNDSPEQRAWLPYAALGIWIAMTGGHLGGVGYVFSFDWSLALLTPALWALSWTWLLQSGAFTSRFESKRAWLVLPLIVTLLAVEQSQLFIALNLLNVAGFALAWWRNRARLLRGLGLLALVSCAANLPTEWVTRFLPGFDRAQWAFACLAVASLAVIVASRNPRWTLAGGGLSALVAAIVATHAGGSMHWAAQAGLVFIVAHSLRWRDAEIVGANVARIFACAVWMGLSLLWSLEDGNEPIYGCGIAGGVVLAFYGLHWLLARTWSPLVVPISGAGVIFTRPAFHIADKLDSISPGYLAVVVSFILFALGTLAALTKHRWQVTGKH